MGRKFLDVPNFAEEEFEVVDGDFTSEQEAAYAKMAEESLPELRRRAGLIPESDSRPPQTDEL